MGHLQMRIGVRKIASHRDLGQDLGAHRDVESFCSLDVFPRAEDVRIALQRRQDRLFESETRDHCLAHAQFAEGFSSCKKKRRNGSEGQKQGAEGE